MPTKLDKFVLIVKSVFEAKQAYSICNSPETPIPPKDGDGKKPSRPHA